MADREHFKYDVFISYSSRDADWVRNWLLPRLEQERLRVCIDFRDFTVGATPLNNMIDAVRSSRKTLLVLTPAYVASEWCEFESVLARTLDPAARKKRVIPLLRIACEPPPFISTLTYIPMQNDTEVQLQLPRLLKALRARAPRPSRPAPDTPPSDRPNPFCTYGPVRDAAQLFDREDILRELRNLLRQGSSVSLVGEPEVGNSSVLHYLYQTRAEWCADRPVCFINLQGVLDEGDLCSEVLAGLDEPPCERTGDLRALRDALRRKRPILLLDQAERLIGAGYTRQLHDLLRAMNDEGVLTLAVSSHRPLAEFFPASSGTSPFHRIFTTKRLKPFTFDQTHAFLERQLQGTGIAFGAEEVQRLFRESGGRPGMLKRLASELFEQKRGG